MSSDGHEDLPHTSEDSTSSENIAGADRPAQPPLLSPHHPSRLSPHATGTDFLTLIKYLEESRRYEDERRRREDEARRAEEAERRELEERRRRQIKERRIEEE